MESGIIELGTDRGNAIGFTPDKFLPMSYLWKKDGAVMISFIASVTPNRGAFKELVDKILSKGWAVEVPTPFPNMERILRKNDYVHRKEWSEEVGEYFDVWRKEPTQ